MADESTEKQHAPTGKRINELRKQGTVLRSRDFTSGLVFVIAVTVIIFKASQIKMTFASNFYHSYSQIKNVVSINDFPGTFLKGLALDNFTLILPFLILILIATVLSPFLFGGWNFSFEVLGFNLSKLNPIQFFKNIFSKKTIFEILRSMFKVIIILSTLLSYAYAKKHEFVSLVKLPAKTAIVAALHLAVQFIALLTITVIVIVIVDAIYHYFEYQNRIKMSFQEVKDDTKDTEGNPEVKRKIRSAQIAILKQNLSVSVPKATVVVTNPTHYAVALRYDDKIDNAPRVLAKGSGYIAQQIRTLAISHGVPLYEAPLLARAIYHTSNINTDIHPGLYMAVAMVLSYVQQLKNYQYGRGQAPTYVTDLKIPDELIYDE